MFLSDFVYTRMCIPLSDVGRHCRPRALPLRDHDSCVTNCVPSSKPTFNQPFPFQLPATRCSSTCTHMLPAPSYLKPRDAVHCSLCEFPSQSRSPSFNCGASRISHHGLLRVQSCILLPPPSPTLPNSHHHSSNLDGLLPRRAESRFAFRCAAFDERAPVCAVKRSLGRFRGHRRRGMVNEAPHSK
jgi:hypothetical protein